MTNCAAVGVLLFSALAAQGAEPAGPAAIVSALVFGGQMAEVRTNGLAADVQASLTRFRKRATQFKPTVRLPDRLDGDEIEDSLYRKHVDLERTVFALFDRVDSLAVSEEFAAQVELRYEWEGMADGPLAEARSADAYRSRHRNSIEP